MTPRKPTGYYITKMYEVKRGIVYLMKFTIGGTDYYKIGYTTKSMEHRRRATLLKQRDQYTATLEIAPVMEIHCDYPFLMESALHKRFNHCRAILGGVCSGSSELFLMRKDIYDTFLYVKNEIEGQQPP